MSSSAVNMCRFVIAVIFITSFVSCVLAGAGGDGNTINSTACRNFPTVKAVRGNMAICFKNIVNLHLKFSNASKSGCQNAADFGEILNIYFNTVNKECNRTLSFNTTNIIKLVDFSLQNDSFKKFYEDIKCVKHLESNISNVCVKGNVGFFNITKEKKHIAWSRKTQLYYNGHTCTTSQDVNNCVKKYLNACHYETRDYVASLFKFAQELGDCSQFKKSAIPPAAGNGAVQSASWLTTPVIITISIGAVVAVVAIIIIIVLKCKH